MVILVQKQGRLYDGMVSKREDKILTNKALLFN